MNDALRRLRAAFRTWVVPAAIQLTCLLGQAIPVSGLTPTPAATPCNEPVCDHVSVEPESAPFELPWEGGEGCFSVQGDPGCRWIAVPAGGAGLSVVPAIARCGSDTVCYRVQPNLEPRPWFYTINVAQEVFAINQHRGPTPGATPTATPDSCVGDCDRDGSVTVDDVYRLLHVILEEASPSHCTLPEFALRNDIGVEDIIAAVDNALSGCPAASHCGLLLAGRVTDELTGLPIAGSSVCLPGGECVLTSQDGFFSRLCYPGESSAGVRPCAAADGYQSTCLGPYTPDGSAVEANFALTPNNMAGGLADRESPVISRGSTATAAITASASCPGQGAPGEITVSLNAGGEAVAGTQNDISFDPISPAIARRINGRPDCTVNPDIAKTSASFAFLPAGCSELDCTGIRAVVFAIDNLDPIADGSVLYTCRLNVPELEPGPDTPLAVSNVILGRPNGLRACGPGSADTPCGGESQEIPCTCARREAAALRFEFDATPASPVVGDVVTVTFHVTNVSGGLAGLPSYSLFGTSPVFNTSGLPMTGGATSLGAETVIYQLRAEQPGSALLQLSVHYETTLGCDPAVFFFDTANSPQFELRVAGLTDTPTATPSLSPRPSDTTPPTLSPTPNVTATASPSPTGVEGNSGGGCHVTPTPSSPAALLALPLLALLRRRRASRRKAAAIDGDYR